VGLKLNWTRQLLVYADNGNLLGDNITRQVNNSMVLNLFEKTLVAKPLIRLHGVVFN
jgi:hypothetical protein